MSDQHYRTAQAIRQAGSQQMAGLFTSAIHSPCLRQIRIAVAQQINYDIVAISWYVLDKRLPQLTSIRQTVNKDISYREWPPQTFITDAQSIGNMQHLVQDLVAELMLGRHQRLLV